MKGLGKFSYFAFFLLLVGGLNIGFAGVFDYNVLAGIFGKVDALLRTIYVLIGVSALWFVYLGVKKDK